MAKRENPIIVWGDGKDLKDFLYIEDFCKTLDKIIKKENLRSLILLVEVQLQ